MKLNLPIFKNLGLTIERWSSILRVQDFVINNPDEDLIPFDSGAAASAVYAMTVAKEKDVVVGYSKKLFPWIWVDMRFSVFLGNVAAPIWFVKLPIPPKEYPGLAVEKGPAFTCHVIDSGTPTPAWALCHNDSFNKSADYVGIVKPNAVNFTLGTCTVFLSGWYRAQT